MGEMGEVVRMPRNPFARGYTVVAEEEPTDPRIRDAYMDLTPSGKGPDGKHFNSLVYEALDLHGNESILNLGSGDGLDEIEWVQTYGHHGPIIGLDIPGKGDEFEKRFVAANDTIKQEGIDNVRFIPGFAQSIPREIGPVEVVTCLSTIYYVNRTRRLFKETLRVLKDRGKAAFSSNAHGNKPRHSDFIKQMGRVTESRPPPAFSSRYRADRLARVMGLYFDNLVYVPRREPIVVETPEEKSVCLESIESYRHLFKSKKHPVRNLFRKKIPEMGWSEARKHIIEAVMDAEIEATGSFTDWVDRLAVIGIKPDRIGPIRKAARRGIIG